MDDDPELDRLAEYLKRVLAALIKQRDMVVVDEMERLVNNEPVLPDGKVILLGYEGQVDVAWDVPEPRPEVLKRPIPIGHDLHVYERDPGPYMPTFRTAEYRRIGEFTYQRER